MLRLVVVARRSTLYMPIMLLLATRATQLRIEGSLKHGHRIPDRDPALARENTAIQDPCRLGLSKHTSSNRSWKGLLKSLLHLCQMRTDLVSPVLSVSPTNPIRTPPKPDYEAMYYAPKACKQRTCQKRPPGFPAPTWPFQRGS